MADPFPVNGSIDPATFPSLVVDLHRQGATGSLKINGPVHPKALYLRGGRVLFGSSNDPRDQLGAILIESGKITREQLDEVNAKVGPGNPLAKVLAESGFVNQRELGDAARVKVERILSDVLSWEEGSFEFEDGVLPKGAVDLKLSTGPLLLAAIQRISERSFALRHLGGDMSLVLTPVPEAEDSLEDVRAEVWPLLERLDGQRSLQDAVALTRFDEFEAAKIACAMLFMGIVRRQDSGGGEELDLAQEAMSGFDGTPAEGAEPTVDLSAETVVLPNDGSPVVEPLDAPSAPSAEPTPLVVPEPEPLSADPVVLDSTPALEGFQIPEPEPIEAEPLPEVEPVPPVAELQPEATVAMPLPESGPAADPEATGFAFVEADDPIPGIPVEPVAPVAPAPPPVVPLAPPPPEPPAALPPEAPADPADFGVAPPPRKETDTVPGDQPAYAPPPPLTSGEETVAVEIPEAPAPTPRPTKEDLAALDELLNPTSDGTATPVERPRAEKWEPQFRPGTTPPGRRAIGRRDGSSRTALYGAIGAVAILVVGAAAGGYFFLGGSADPTPPATAASAPPVTAPTPALSAPATLAPTPAVDPASAAPAVGDPAATPDAGTAVPPDPTPPVTAATVPPSVPAPTPTPAAVAPPAPAPAADALALLRQGDLDASARQSASTLATGPRGRFGIQALVACAPETVHKAVQAVADDQLFVLPVNYKGRDCHRICWGVFDDRAAAEAAARSFPAYFRQNGISPRIQPLADLLP